MLSTRMLMLSAALAGTDLMRAEMQEAHARNERAAETSEEPPRERAIARVFANTAMVPENVTLYVQVNGAGAMYGKLRDRPIAEWVKSQAGGGQAARAWASLAEGMGMSAGELFEQALGRSFTLVVRSPMDRAAAADADYEWAVMTSVDEAVTKQLLRRMRVMVDLLGPCELPEQDLLIEWDEWGMIIGPKTRRGLFDEMCRRHEEVRPTETLADSGVMQWARELGDGAIGVMIRHAEPVGGWSAAVGELAGDELTIRQMGRFRNTPFKGDLTRTKGDYSTITKLEGGHMVVVAEPMDKGEGLVEHYVMRATGEQMLSEELRAKLSDRRITAIGEVEEGGETGDDAADLVVVCALELNTAAGAEEEVSERLRGLMKRISEQTEGTMLASVDGGVAGSGERMEWRDGMSSGLTGGFPVMKGAKLAWCVIEAEDGSWLVVASNRRSLEEFCADLKKPTERRSELRGQYEAVGSINGMRLGRHLHGLANEAALAVGAAGETELRGMLEEFGRLAEGVETCRWQMSRPGVNEMKVEVQVKLAPAQSSAEGEKQED